MKQSDLKSSGHGAEEHNFDTSTCKVRDFEKMESQLKDQIDALDEEFYSIDQFCDIAFTEGRHDIERSFRDKGKNHESVIGRVNTGVESMEYVLGGPLHNEIGIGNDVLDQLSDELEAEGMKSVCGSIKSFLNTSKATGGAGCTPGQHHGGKYNGKNLVSLGPGTDTSPKSKPWA